VFDWLADAAGAAAGLISLNWQLGYIGSPRPARIDEKSESKLDLEYEVKPMSYPFPPDISAIVQHQVAAGYFATEDDVLRAALGYLVDDEDDLRAIEESIHDLEEGDPGRPADEVFAELRARYNIPSDQ
jgi:antitoxin ParD1/3/4